MMPQKQYDSVESLFKDLEPQLLEGLTEPQSDLWKRIKNNSITDYEVGQLITLGGGKESLTYRALVRLKEARQKGWINHPVTGASC